MAPLLLITGSVDGGEDLCRALLPEGDKTLSPWSIPLPVAVMMFFRGSRQYFS